MSREGDRCPDGIGRVLVELSVAVHARSANGMIAPYYTLAVQFVARPIWYMGWAVVKGGRDAETP